jgi:iron complex transport system substrate-binding protein
MVPDHRSADPVGFADLISTVATDRIRCVLLALCATAAVACNPNSENDASPVAGGPAGRIITLAPHLTELAFAAGAGGRLVGVVAYSDFPPEARSIRRVGDAFRLDHETILELDPDLILAWASGNPVAMVDRLRALGYRVVALEPAGLDSIPEHLIEIGRLAGTADTARTAAAEFVDGLSRIRKQYSDLAEISVLYQISQRPMLTISRRHVIGEAIEMCGGTNVFADVDALTPAVSVETALDRAPEAIIIGSTATDGGEYPDGLTEWSRWESIPAVRYGNLFVIEADLISRPGPRILAGVRSLCVLLSTARDRRSAN